MPLPSTTLRKVVCSGLLPIIGLLPFIVLLHRDFAEFQSAAPLAARTQSIPFTPARAVAAVIAVASVFVGIPRFAIQLDSFPELVGASGRRHVVFLAYCITFFAFIYFTAPSNYWIW